MDNHTEVLACVAAAGLLIINEHRNQRDTKLIKNKRKKRKWWVRPILSEENRYMHGAEALLNEMRLNDIESFYNYTRMSPNSFDKLLHLVGPHITKQQNLIRSSIAASTKLALTLRYLASGDSQASISYSWGPVLPYYLLGDEAFGLKTWLITPYSGKSSGNLEYSKLIFNYRQSRARRVIQNCFGLLVSRWRVLKKSLAVSTDNSDKVVLAVVCLHNFCLAEEEITKAHQRKYLVPTSVDRENSTGELIHGTWRTELGILPQISRQGAYDATTAAVEIRNMLAEYFMTDDSIPWQWSMVE